MLFEEMGIFYRGVILGIMLAAPVGPIGLLCIRRTIQKGLLIGFATGFGAACADTLFGAVAAFGVAAILKFIQHYNVYIRCLGGAFLFFIAWHTWHDKPKQPQQDPRVTGVLKALMSGFVITMTNPITIFAILAVVATFGNFQKHNDAVTIVGGIFSGSIMWWLLLSGGITLVRGHFTENRVIYINRITAIALALLAAAALATGIVGFLENKTF